MSNGFRSGRLIGALRALVGTSMLGCASEPPAVPAPLEPPRPAITSIDTACEGGDARGIAVPLCDEGDVAACGAMMDLAYRWSTPADKETDPPYAFERGVAEKACALDDVAACSSLGSRHATDEAALELKRCRLGDSEACLALVQRGGAESRTYGSRARLLIETECELGDPLACGALARAAEKLGKTGTHEGIQRAIELLQSPCERGIAQGCLVLAERFFNGDWIPRDVERAQPYYRRAGELFEKECDAGTPTACDFVAEFYREGKGFAVDLARAEQFEQKACTLRQTCR